jgi:hypothetical protein
VMDVEVAIVMCSEVLSSYVPCKSEKSHWRLHGIKRYGLGLERILAVIKCGQLHCLCLEIMFMYHGKYVSHWNKDQSVNIFRELIAVCFEVQTEARRYTICGRIKNFWMTKADGTHSVHSGWRG